MNIGSLQLNGKCLLAPMAGVADRAFRELCVGFGAAYTVGEMASAKALCFHDQKTHALLKIEPAERPAAIQLFGNDPDDLARAVGAALQYKPDVIDINLGCPAPKIVNNGCGSALLRDPKRCGELVAAAVRASAVPVTVKIRKGIDGKNTALETARYCRQAGAAAIAVHGRTREQMYGGTVDLELIAQVKQEMDIPVIGNGDVNSPARAKEMLEQTGCDAVMIGRGALGNPYLFTQINAYLERGEALPDLHIKEKMEIMLRHISLICQYKGEQIGMKESRKHASWHLKGLKGAASLRNTITSLSRYDDIEALVVKIIEENQ